MQGTTAAAHAGGGDRAQQAEVGQAAIDCHSVQHCALSLQHAAALRGAARPAAAVALSAAGLAGAGAGLEGLQEHVRCGWRALQAGAGRRAAGTAAGERHPARQRAPAPPAHPGVRGSAGAHALQLAPAPRRRRCRRRSHRRLVVAGPGTQAAAAAPALPPDRVHHRPAAQVQLRGTAQGAARLLVPRQPRGGRQVGAAWGAAACCHLSALWRADQHATGTCTIPLAGWSASRAWWCGL